METLEYPGHGGLLPEEKYGNVGLGSPKGGNLRGSRGIKSRKALLSLTKLLGSAQESVLKVSTAVQTIHW